jgi:hypothetical protein
VSFTVFGREVWAFECQQQDAAGVLAEAIAEYAEDQEEPAMGGGSGHNFERDLAPVSPDDRYAPWEDRFGFQP